MREMRVYPHQMNGGSLVALRNYHHFLQVYADRGYRPRNNQLVVNWGCCRKPETWEWDGDRCPAKFLNHPESVAIAASKLASFRAFDQAHLPTVDYTKELNVAEEWLSEDEVVLARELDRGHGGRGITVLNPADDPKIFKERMDYVLEARNIRFFTRYQTHVGEYRVHVAGGEVIDFVKKKKMDDEKINILGYNYCKYVRNHNRGWVFAREDVDLPEGVAELSIQAVKSLALDFGAVDMIYSKKYGMFLLEVNTAPGLEGTTLKNYAEYFSQERGD